MVRVESRSWIAPLFQPVTSLGLGMGIVVVTALFYLVAKDRNDAYVTALRNGDNLARLFEGYVTRTIGSADHTLLFLRKMYQQNPKGFSLAAVARDPDIANELTFQFTIADADGTVLDSSYSPGMVGAYRGDQDAFRFHAHSPFDELFISRPLPMTSSGKWAIVLSRRLSAPDGSFSGIIAATVDPQQFQKLYTTLNLGADGLMSLLSLDGVIYTTSQSPHLHDDLVGRSIPTAPVFQLYREKAAGHYWSNMTQRDSIKRLISYRAIESLPMIAIVGVTEQQVFRYVNERAIVYYAIAAIIMIAILIMIAWGLLRERALRRANMWLEQALTNMPHGICMFGADKRLKISNALYATMYGLTTEQTRPGTTLLEILKARIASGCSPRDYDNYIAERLNEAFVPEPAYIVNELRDGRIIGISRRPMPDGGSVAVHQDITEQKRAQEKIAHLAHYDGLTNLANRALFVEHVARACDDCSRYGRRFAVHLLDLDRFKEVNDSLGHAVGDALLQRVASRLVKTVPHDAIVGRLGGDEFIVLQPIENAGAADAISLATRLLAAIARPYEVEEHHLAIETSIGIALVPENGLSPDELLKKADLALYRAKSDGRNGWRLFEADMEREAKERLALAMDLRDAIQRHEEFELHYQPVVSTADERLAGAEALVRWRHPRQGLVEPTSFIPLAEDTGLIVPLGDWVLHHACAEAATWPAPLKIAVNLSPVQFRAGNLVEVVQSALSVSGLSPDRLELEITETVLLQNNQDNRKVLLELQALGVSIVLDDFGTGYSSLSYLLSFPFDKIKIDRQFVAGLTRRSECAAIVSAVTGLARMLEIVVTAEGVETGEHLILLRTAGCALAQGYLFGRPVEAADFRSDWLSEPADDVLFAATNR